MARATLLVLLGLAGCGLNVSPGAHACRRAFSDGGCGVIEYCDGTCQPGEVDASEDAGPLTCVNIGGHCADS